MMRGTKKIKEMILKKEVNQPGVCGWIHTPEVDRKESEEFSERIIELTEQNQWDFIKIMENGVYNQEAYGSDIEYLSENIPLEKLKTKQIMHFNRYLLNSPEDFNRFPVVNVNQNLVYQREIKVVEALRKHYRGEIPIIPTIFLPAHTVPEFCGGIDKARYYFDNYPEAVENMLKAFTQTLIQLADSYIEAGADGFFFANRYSNSDIISEMEFERFCIPFDMEIINHIKERTWFNIIHIHGERRLFIDKFDQYAVQALSWENCPHGISQEEQVSVAEVRRKTNKILITGTDQFADFYGNKKEVKACLERRFERAIKEAEDGRLIFAPGCSLPLDIDFKNLKLMKEVVQSYSL